MYVFSVNTERTALVGTVKADPDVNHPLTLEVPKLLSEFFFREGGWRIRDD